MEKAKKIIILGVAGMLGHTIFRKLSQKTHYLVWGTVRNLNGIETYFKDTEKHFIISSVDATNFDSICHAIAIAQPDVVINCIGIIKQSEQAADPLTSITINSQFPHRLALLCRAVNARMIHISTDCVFDGSKGSYTEEDDSTAKDLYGKSKYLGEVTYPHCITLRTSIIGHELKGVRSLLEWFLSQEGSVCGFTKAIFSGLTTIELADVIETYVLPNKEHSGVYHVSASPISKYELLRLIAKIYDKKIEIVPENKTVVDRSLNSARFQQEFLYRAPSWEEMLGELRSFYLREYCLAN